MLLSHTLGSSGSTALHSVNNRTLSLKQIKQGASVSVTENSGDILITNTAPHVNQVTDTQVTSHTAYSSQKLTTDFVPYSNIHGSTRSSNTEIYNVPFINSLETSLTSAINGKASLSHTHNISEINNLTATLNLKLSTSVTTLGASGTSIHNVNGSTLGLKTFTNGTGIDVHEANGIITISNIAPNVDQIDDTQTTSTTAFSSQKTENTYFPISNVHGSIRSSNTECYGAVYINNLETTLNNSINQKLSTSVTTLGASGVVLYTVSNISTLGLKTITHGSGINVSENAGIVSIENTAPHVNVLPPNASGFLRNDGVGNLTYTTPVDNYITQFSLANGLLTGAMTGGQANPTGQILPTNAVGYLYNNGSALSYATPTSLPTQTGQSDKFLKTDGTSASWTNKIGSSTAHTWFYWSGGVPNHYLMNQATAAGAELGNIAFGTTGGKFYASIAGKIRNSSTGSLRGYIQINTQNDNGTDNLDEETLRIGESTHATSDAGEFFGNLKVA